MADGGRRKPAGSAVAPFPNTSDQPHHLWFILHPCPAVVPAPANPRIESSICISFSPTASIALAFSFVGVFPFDLSFCCRGASVCNTTGGPGAVRKRINRFGAALSENACSPAKYPSSPRQFRISPRVIFFFRKRFAAHQSNCIRYRMKKDMFVSEEGPFVGPFACFASLLPHARPTAN